MPIMTQATEASIATKVTLAQVNSDAQLAGLSQVTGLQTALNNKVNSIETFRTIAASFSISKDIDLNNVIYCVNPTPIDIFNFDNGGLTTPIGWKTKIIVDPGASFVNIKTNGDPTVINLTTPGQTHSLKPGQVAILEKIAESGGNKYYLINGANLDNPPSKLIYVSKNGIDDDPPTGRLGDGSYNNPFASYNYAVAYAATLSPSVTNPIAIIMTEGDYTQSTAMTIRPWVNLIGVGRPTINFTTADIITPVSPFGTSGISQFVAQGLNLHFAESQDIDFVAGGAGMWVNFIDCLPYKSPTKTVTFNNPLGGELSIYFSNNDNYTAVNASTPTAILLDITFNNTDRVFINNSAFNNLTFSNVSYGSVYEISNTKIYDQLSFTKTGVVVSSYTLTNNSIYELTADGSLTVNLDSASYPTNGATLLNSAALNLLTVSDAVDANYIPVNYTPTNVSVKGHLEGIDAELVGALNTWTTVTGTSQAMAVNNGYITDNAAFVTLTLPATAAVGDKFSIQGFGAGGWRVAQNSGQSIRLGNAVTTTGAGGYVASTNRYDDAFLVCIVANTTFKIVNAIGNLDLL